MNKMFLSVIIPTYKDWKRLNTCLQALDAQSLSKDRFEIIVVNNDPNDVMPDDYGVPSNARILTEVAAGSYAARNKGVKNAKGEILAFTDSDCIPDKDWLKNANDYFRNENTGRVGGNVKVFFRDAEHKTGTELYESLFAFQQEKKVARLKGSVTANLFVRKEDFLKVGFFNSKRFSGEDFHWNLRATEKGLNIDYAKDVIIYHPARYHLKELLRKSRRVLGGVDKKERLKRVVRIQFTSRLKKVLLEENSLSLKDKIKLVWTIFMLFIDQVFELIRLKFGGTPERQ